MGCARYVLVLDSATGTCSRMGDSPSSLMHRPKQELTWDVLWSGLLVQDQDWDRPICLRFCVCELEQGIALSVKMQNDRERERQKERWRLASEPQGVPGRKKVEPSARRSGRRHRETMCKVICWVSQLELAPDVQSARSDLDLQGCASASHCVTSSFCRQALAQSSIKPTI